MKNSQNNYFSDGAVINETFASSNSLLKKKKYLPRYIYWELCDHCNLHCITCFANSNPTKHSFVEKEKLFNKIDEITRENKVPIHFGGGEPFLLPYISELFEFLINRKQTFSINTNGVLINDSYIEQLNRSALDKITVSIDGTEEYNDLIRGNGTFNKALNSVKAMIDAEISVSLSFTITAINYENLERYVDYFYKQGIRRFYFFRYVSDEARDNKLKLSKEDLLNAYSIINSMIKKYRDTSFVIERIVYFPFLIDEVKFRAKCEFAKKKMTIRHDGDVLVCSAIRKKLGNIFTDDLYAIYRHIENEIEAILEIPKTCINCTYVTLCKGGCKSFSYSRFGDYCHRDELCYKDIIKKREED